jgi:hypothetical protein
MSYLHSRSSFVNQSLHMSSSHLNFFLHIHRALSKQLRDASGRTWHANLTFVTNVGEPRVQPSPSGGSVGGLEATLLFGLGESHVKAMLERCAVSRRSKVALHNVVCCLE